MIICCGECLIDMLPRQLADGSDVFLPVSGGAVFNTAISLGRLGQKTGFVSGVSNDMFGEQLLESLEQSQVSTKYCVRSERNSTLAFVKLTDGQASYSFFDENSAGRMLEKGDLPELPEETQALHFGAISLIPEPSGSSYEALMERHAGSAVISLDPNIRPGFIPDAEKHRARINRMIAMSDIVKVSDEDLSWLEPETDLQDAIGLIQSKGVSIVLLTKGSEGVSVYYHGGKIDVQAQQVEVVDTIGAGDSFNGGFLAGLAECGCLSQEKLKAISATDLAGAVELANKVAAITVSRAGANPPLRKEIK